MDSAAKPSGKPLPGDKTCGLEPAIRLYAMEDSYETEKGEEVEILVITTKASRKLRNKEKKHNSLSSRLKPHGVKIHESLRCESRPNDSPTSRSNQSTNLTTTL